MTSALLEKSCSQIPLLAIVSRRSRENIQPSLVSHLLEQDNFLGQNVFSTKTSYILLIIGLISVAASQVLIKWRFTALMGDQQAEVSRVKFILSSLGDFWLWVALLLILIAATTWYTAMTRLPLNVMLPMSGIVSPLVILLAFTFLKEPLSLNQIIAIFFISFGVIWLGLMQQ